MKLRLVVPSEHSEPKLVDNSYAASAGASDEGKGRTKCAGPGVSLLSADSSDAGLKAASLSHDSSVLQHGSKARGTEDFHR